VKLTYKVELGQSKRILAIFMGIVNGFLTGRCDRRLGILTRLGNPLMTHADKLKLDQMKAGGYDQPEKSMAHNLIEWRSRA